MLQPKLSRHLLLQLSTPLGQERMMRWTNANGISQPQRGDLSLKDQAVDFLGTEDSIFRSCLWFKSSVLGGSTWDTFNCGDTKHSATPREVLKNQVWVLKMGTRKPRDRQISLANRTLRNKKFLFVLLKETTRKLGQQQTCWRRYVPLNPGIILFQTL